MVGDDASSNPRTIAARPCGSPHWQTRTLDACAAPEVTLGKVQPGFTYAVRVSAENAAGSSRVSTTSEITTPPGPKATAAAPPPPEVLEVSAAEAVLKWGLREGPPARVEVDVAKVPPHNGGEAAAAWHRVYRGCETACLVTGLSPGTAYVFRMREAAEPAHEGGEGEWSECAAVTTLLAAPPPPVALVAGARAPTAVRLTWQSQLKAGCAASQGYRCASYCLLAL